MKALAGVTILDFSRVLAGPMATQILAELGATVIKVERLTGDESRHYEPHLPQGESAYFLAFNRGKRSITLNLKSPRGQWIARGLARQADVVVENFLPGTMDKWGLGYECLGAEDPRLVYVSNTGFGQSGPYRDRKGYDSTFQAQSGIMSLTGAPEDAPVKTGIPVSDMTAGLWVVVAILTGLASRGSTGEGCYIDVAMMDVQVSLLALSAARLFTLNEDPVRSGTEHPGRVPSAAFQCDGGEWLHISASDQDWEPLCRVLGLDQLSNDGTLNSNTGRIDARTRVMDAIRKAVVQRERSALAAELRTAKVPVGEVKTVREVLNDPHTVSREMVGRFEHPTEGFVRGLRTPLRIEGLDDPDFSTPPLLGADTDDVLSHYLGLNPTEIAVLRLDGVIS